MNQNTVEHVALHFAMAWAVTFAGGGIYGPISSAAWAVALEIGDGLAHRRDPALHREGFDLVDLVGRLAGSGLFLLLIWGFSNELY